MLGGAHGRPRLIPSARHIRANFRALPTPGVGPERKFKKMWAGNGIAASYIGFRVAP